MSSRAPESQLLEIKLKSIYIRFEPNSPILKDELDMLVNIIGLYAKHKEEMK